MAWYGNYLYVADTTKGLRVFDLTRILTVSTQTACSSRVGAYNGAYCAFGYLYALPQVGTYRWPTGTGASCKPSFSTLALDRSTTPPQLVAAEYDSSSIYGRVVHWPLDTSTHRLAGNGEPTAATGAWYMGQRNIQGAVSDNGIFRLNATRYCGSHFVTAPNHAARVLKESSNQWGAMPEGMHYSTTGNLWNITEGHFSRSCNLTNCSAGCNSNTCSDSQRIVFATSLPGF